MSSLSLVPDTPKQTQPLSGRQRKRWKQKQHVKELRRQNVYDKNRVDQYEASDYYFENGLRKVYPYHFTFTTCVQESWAGRPILEVFAQQFQSNTKENYRKAIEAGHLRVNGGAVSVDYLLQLNDIIVSRIHRHENPVTDEAVEIIHEDKDVLVVDKPASIPCQPCGRYRFNSVAFILCKELGIPMLRNIHRLDWLTSGVMICAKTTEKASILEHQIQNGFVTKEYVARVQGEFPLGEVTLNQPIGCVSHRLFLWKVTPTGKPSKTRFERMSYNGTSSVVKCVPLEVRTAHHIRVHLQFLGHPIVNDPVYNSEVWGPSRGKAGVYDRPDSEVITDVVEIHTVGRWTEERNPILDLKNMSQSFDDSTNADTYATASSLAKVESHLGASGRQACEDSLDEIQHIEKEPCEISDLTIAPSVDIKTANSHTHSRLVSESRQSVTGEGNSHSNSAVGKGSEDSQECTCPCTCGKRSKRKAQKYIRSDESSHKSWKNQESQTVWSDVKSLNAADSLTCSSESQSPSVSNLTLHSALPSDDAPHEPAVKKFKSVSEDCDLDKNKSNGHEPTLSDCTVQTLENAAFRVSGETQSQGQCTVSKPPSRLGFNINKWTPDPHCAECSKKYIDPDPAKLMIYLHAQRYKGPGWEYSTKLPSWAKEDWQGK